MPKLSIITINYNNAPGLRKTLESVKAQTTRDFEHIIIDGGSTDESMEVIKSFTDIPSGIYTPPAQSASQSLPCPITYWISEPDKGIYNAMNKGICQAKGEYCQFLNSGDWLVSQEVTEKMLAEVPVDSSILIGNMFKILANGKVYEDKGAAYQQPTFLTFYRGTLNHSTAYIKRKLFDQYGMYDETMQIVSDWKWYVQVIGLMNEPVKYIDIFVTCFDMTGISSLKAPQEKKERRKVLEELLPENILADYDAHWRDIDQARRINRFALTRWFFWFVERVLFKLEKWKVKAYN